MPFASVPESVPALSGGSGGGKGKGANGSQMADAVPATLPPRKNYDDDSNGGLRISETLPYESSSASQSPSRPPVGDREKEGSKSPEGGRNAAGGGGGAGTGGDSSEVDLESLESGRGGG